MFLTYGIVPYRSPFAGKEEVGIKSWTGKACRALMRKSKATQTPNPPENGLAGVRR